MRKYGTIVRLTFPTFEFEKFLMRLVVVMSQTGLSHSDLAHRANLCESTICRIMSRRSKNMFVGTAAKLAKASGMSADYMLGLRAARTKREHAVEAEAQANFEFESGLRYKAGY